LDGGSALRYTRPVSETLPQELARKEANSGGAPYERLASRFRLLNWSGILFAILQSACAAVIAISSLRVAIGLGALAAAAGVHAPARGFHQDAIRIPMMLLALTGSLVNLLVIWKIRKLRKKPAARWRQQEIPRQKLRSENFQIALSLLTLMLLAAEWITHPMIHRLP